MEHRLRIAPTDLTCLLSKSAVQSVEMKLSSPEKIVMEALVAIPRAISLPPRLAKFAALLQDHVTPKRLAAGPVQIAQAINSSPPDQFAALQQDHATPKRLAVGPVQTAQVINSSPPGKSADLRSDHATPKRPAVGPVQIAQPMCIPMAAFPLALRVLLVMLAPSTPVSPLI